MLCGLSCFFACLTSSKKVINSYWIKYLDRVPESGELIYSALDEKNMNFFHKSASRWAIRLAELSTHWRSLESALEFDSG